MGRETENFILNESGLHFLCLDSKWYTGPDTNTIYCNNLKLNMHNQDIL